MAFLEVGAHILNKAPTVTRKSIGGESLASWAMAQCDCVRQTERGEGPNRLASASHPVWSHACACPEAGPDTATEQRHLSLDENNSRDVYSYIVLMRHTKRMIGSEQAGSRGHGPPCRVCLAARGVCISCENRQWHIIALTRKRSVEASVRCFFVCAAILDCLVHLSLTSGL